MDKPVTQASQQTNVRFGPFDVDLLTGEVRKHGVRLRLAGQPFQILALLLERPGELVTREDLRNKLWSTETFVDFDHSLNAAVNKLREALGDSADNPRYVETLPRRGYRIIVPVEPVNGPRPMNLAAATREEDGGKATETPRTARWLVAGGLIIATAAILLLWFGGRIANFYRPKPLIAQQIRTIAVLPFANLSPDAGQEYFADGLTDELITEMARFGALRVTSRTSVMQFKGANKPVKEIAEKLGVDAVIEGAVRREGDHVRVSAQLIHAQTDQHLWAATYERDLGGVLALQSELAAQIADQVRVRARVMAESADAAAALDPDFVQLYLQGKYAQQGATPRIKGEAQNYFEQAVARNANFAPAWAALAESALFKTPPRTQMPRAKEAAQRALRLDPNSADAHAAMGLVKTMWDWDFPGGEESFRRAITLNPSHAEARHRYAYNLNAQGRIDDALAELNRALAIDPLSPEITTYLGRTYFFARRYEEAERAFQRAIQLRPDYFYGHFFRAILHEQMGDYDVAVNEFLNAYGTNNTLPDLTERGRELYQKGGYKEFHKARLRLVELWANPQGLGSSALALMNLRIGENEKALQWLERSFESHAGDLIYLNVEPQYEPIRNDPRFQAMVRRLGLPAPNPQRSAPAATSAK